MAQVWPTMYAGDISIKKSSLIMIWLIYDMAKYHIVSDPSLQ
jgi:hypothetical protein